MVFVNAKVPNGQQQSARPQEHESNFEQVCGICGDNTNVQLISNVIVCEDCRRIIVYSGYYEEPYKCVSGNYDCDLTFRPKRELCNACRLHKAIDLGLEHPSIPTEFRLHKQKSTPSHDIDQSEATDTTILLDNLSSSTSECDSEESTQTEDSRKCYICNNPHYVSLRSAFGVPCCNNCRNFLTNTIDSGMSFECDNDDNCIIEWKPNELRKSPNLCKACRWRKAAEHPDFKFRFCGQQSRRESQFDPQAFTTTSGQHGRKTLARPRKSARKLFCKRASLYFSFVRRIYRFGGRPNGRTIMRYNRLAPKYPSSGRCKIELCIVKYLCAGCKSKAIIRRPRSKLKQRRGRFRSKLTINHVSPDDTHKVDPSNSHASTEPGAEHLNTREHVRIGRENSPCRTKFKTTGKIQGEASRAYEHIRKASEGPDDNGKNYNPNLYCHHCRAGIQYTSIRGKYCTCQHEATCSISCKCDHTCDACRWTETVGDAGFKHVAQVGDLRGESRPNLNENQIGSHPSNEHNLNEPDQSGCRQKEDLCDETRGSSATEHFPASLSAAVSDINSQKDISGQAHDQPVAGVSVITAHQLDPEIDDLGLPLDIEQRFSSPLHGNFSCFQPRGLTRSKKQKHGVHTKGGIQQVTFNNSLEDQFTFLTENFNPEGNLEPLSEILTPVLKIKPSAGLLEFQRAGASRRHDSNCSPELDSELSVTFRLETRRTIIDRRSILDLQRTATNQSGRMDQGCETEASLERPGVDCADTDDNEINVVD